MKKGMSGVDVIVLWMKAVVVTFVTVVLIVGVMVLFGILAALLKSPWVLVGLLLITIVGITSSAEEANGREQGTKK